MQPIVNAEYPAFEPVPKPSLHIIKSSDLTGISKSTLQQLVENDQLLKTHAKRLQAQIDAYMVWRSEQD